MTNKRCYSFASKGVIPITNATSVARVYVLGCPSLLQARLSSILDHIDLGRTTLAFREMDEVLSDFGEDDLLVDLIRQFSALVRKVPFKSSDIDREAVAMASFFSSERSCARVNRRFRFFRLFPGRRNHLYTRVLHHARSYIYSAIGDLTPQKYEKILERARPGPGLSLGTWNKFRCSGEYKYSFTTPMYTPLTRGVLVDWINRYGYTVRKHGTLQKGKIQFPINDWCTAGNRITFVPKDGRSLRSIAIEPAFNVMAQLGVHEYLTPLLERKRVCVLNDQRQNQLLAKLGSLAGPFGLATLDLKSASDSISIELVRELLPPMWYTLLSSLRSPTCTLKGVTVTTEKFSTMGNGFTFVLESLIFKALSEAVRMIVGGSITSVYGDDIIIDNTCAPLLIEVLKFCGLKVNTSKSFFFGDFRESCGADWRKGLAVTPIYVRSETLTTMDCNRLINEMPTCDPFSGVRAHLLSLLSANGALLFGLENEDSSSCVFTTLSYLRGSNKGDS